MPETATMRDEFSEINEIRGEEPASKVLILGVRCIGNDCYIEGKHVESQRLPVTTLY